MIRLAVPLLILATGAGAAAASGEQRRPDPAMARVERSLTGLKAGAPRNCVRRDEITEIQTAQDVILYIGGRDRLYRNAVTGHCAGLKRGDMVVSLNADAREYCRGDIIQTRERTGGGFTGSCALGQFTPYTK